jgi:hypothetical protein
MTTNRPPIRPQFPSDRKIVTNDGSITPAWDYFFRNIVRQLPNPGEAVVGSDFPVTINTEGRSLIEYLNNGTTLIDGQLHFPQLTGDVTNEGLELSLANVGTPVNDSFSRITTDSAGRVTSTTPITQSDITSLVNSTYVNVGGDTMTGTLSVPSINNLTNIQFNTAGTTGPLAAGAIRWNSSDGTLDIGDGTNIQQVGLETWVKVYNDTASTIANGSVVGFSGTGPEDSLKVTPYLADGSSPTLYILGVLTQEIPPAAWGKATVWGYVRDIDTSAFGIGDILYASPSTAGAFTNIKPTAPQNVIPVAAVAEVGATTGRVFVRPTIEQQKSYGVFTKTTTATLGTANTATAISFDLTTISNGITIGTPTSRFEIGRSGLYRLSFSAQLNSSSGSQKTVYFWIRKNGVDISQSSVIVTVNLNNGYTPVTRNDILSLDSGDYVEYYWAGDSTALSLVPVAATAFSPSSPAAVVEFSQVQQ